MLGRLTNKIIDFSKRDMLSETQILIIGLICVAVAAYLFSNNTDKNCGEFWMLWLQGHGPKGRALRSTLKAPIAERLI